MITANFAVETHKIQSIEDLEESVDINEVFEASVSVGDHAFSRMEADHDRLRKEKLTHFPDTSVQQHCELERSRR